MLVEIESLLPGHDFSTILTRSTFEEINMKIFEKTLDHISYALKDADLERKDIDDIVLVGGSSKIPKIQQLLRKYFKGKEINKSMNPDESIASILKGDQELENHLLMDITPLTLGIGVKGGLFSKIINRNKPIQAIAEEEFSTTEDNQSEVEIQVFQG